LLDLAGATDERRCRLRQRGVLRLQRFGAGEALAQEGGQVIGHQRLELGGGGEDAIGHVPGRLDVGDEGCELRVAVGGGFLDVQQSRQVAAQPELVVQPGDVHVRCDPAVALPVQADEDLRLLQVRPVQRARRVRAGTELEHDRDQALAGDRVADGGTLLAQLDQGGGDEDPQPLVGGQDGHGRAPTGSSVMPMLPGRHTRWGTAAKLKSPAITAPRAR
jgi:hypothetical protein